MGLLHCPARMRERTRERMRKRMRYDDEGAGAGAVEYLGTDVRLESARQLSLTRVSRATRRRVLPRGLDAFLRGHARVDGLGCRRIDWRLWQQNVKRNVDMLANAACLPRTCLPRTCLPRCCSLWTSSVSLSLSTSSCMPVVSNWTTFLATFCMSSASNTCCMAFISHATLS